MSTDYNDVHTCTQYKIDKLNRHSQTGIEQDTFYISRIRSSSPLPVNKSAKALRVLPLLHKSNNQFVGVCWAREGRQMLSDCRGSFKRTSAVPQFCSKPDFLNYITPLCTADPWADRKTLFQTKRSQTSPHLSGTPIQAMAGKTSLMGR